MPVIFFEGFNYSDSDIIKLDTNYWSSNDNSKLSFVVGRTGNQIKLANRPSASGLEANTTLTLSNVNPLSNYDAFGFGFYSDSFTIFTGPTSREYSVSPYAENLISLMNSGVEVLSFKIIRTTFNSTNSMAIGVYQNSQLLTAYDFKSPVGYSWPIYSQNTIPEMAISNSSFIEFYVDAKNNNQVAIRFSAYNTLNTHLLNSSGNIFTPISGFNTLSNIIYYGTASHIGSNSRGLDDFYVTAGSNISECLLGRDTYIYRLNPNIDVSSNGWSGRIAGSISNPSYSFLDDNDGDSGYIFASESGSQALYGMPNISVSAPSGVAGLKLINVAKKTSLDENKSFANVMTSGNGLATQIEPTYTVDSIDYKAYTNFVFTNPQTGSGWKQSEINDMQLGVKII